MPKKRRNNGRYQQNGGDSGIVVCCNCGRAVPKDKCIKRFQIKDVVEATAHDDISQVMLYDQMIIPKTYMKNVYCVSCACHARIVKVRSTEDRKVRHQKPEKDIEDKPLGEQKEAKVAAVAESLV